MFNKFKKNIIQSRKNEEWLYEKVLAEVESGNIRRGLYAKALSQSDGDEKKAQSIYLKLRVQSIIDDDEELRILQEEQNSSYDEDNFDYDSIDNSALRKLLGKKGYTMSGEFPKLDVLLPINPLSFNEPMKYKKMRTFGNARELLNWLKHAEYKGF